MAVFVPVLLKFEHRLTIVEPPKSQKGKEQKVGIGADGTLPGTYPRLQGMQ